MKKGGEFLGDPIIRISFGVTALVIVGALLTIIFSIINGVITIDNDIPRTIEEYKLAQAHAGVGINESAESVGNLALEQIDAGRFSEAVATIALGREQDFQDEERNYAFDYAEAYMLDKQGEKARAIGAYENIRSLIKEAWDRVAQSGVSPNWALANGMHPNYFASGFALARLHQEQGDNTKALELLDEYIEQYPIAADVLVVRGDLKLAMGDVAGAREDFNKALTYIPDDELALEGLRKAGGN
jgi:tetratricopeptide (TPR) repeat protein